jgi:hypothetical protein
MTDGLTGTLPGGYSGKAALSRELWKARMAEVQWDSITRQQHMTINILVTNA